jgi:hypothetical protein
MAHGSNLSRIVLRISSILTICRGAPSFDINPVQSTIIQCFKYIREQSENIPASPVFSHRKFLTEYI